MTKMKTLMLAGLATLSLGVGGAMAQEGPLVPSPTDWAATPGDFHQVTNASVSPVPATTPQAGAADRLPTDYSVSEGLMAGGG